MNESLIVIGNGMAAARFVEELTKRTLGLCLCIRLPCVIDLALQEEVLQSRRGGGTRD
jgi:hypothetical protein